MFSSKYFHVFGSLAAVILSIPANAAATGSQCRTFPGDATWPTAAEWNAFNQSVGGRLVETIPLGTVCHDSAEFPGTFDAGKCAALQENWFNADIHVTTSSSIMAPFFANQSCDPFSGKDGQCITGNYVQYAVKASGAADYQKTLAFATAHNIRLVVRNTGHDYHGKSTGAGALALWTQGLKDIKIDKKYCSTSYNGPAIKVGAGVLVREAREAAKREGLVVVVGNCPTVGVAGGYSQGGGHGPLTSAYGLSADNVLEWEVVTATGNVLVATPQKNSDLYWALSGGGGGTYAAVLSVTLRAYPDKRTAAASLGFTMDGVSQDVFFKGVEAFIATLPSLVDKKTFVIWLLTAGSLDMKPATAPGLTKIQLDALLAPLRKKLTALGIKYTYEVQDYATYMESQDAMSPPIAVNNVQMGGRFVPRELVSASNLPKLISTLKDITNAGTIISGLGVNANNQKPIAANSVNPLWRTSIFAAVIGTLWDNTNMEANLAAQRLVTEVAVPKLAAITPGGGAYLNEADFRQPNFRSVFYGSNYNKLREIKRKYDPKDLFYGLTAVGSDEWTYETEDGRLCRTGLVPRDACKALPQLIQQCAKDLIHKW